MKERQENLRQAKTRDYDLVVIGAGITGAGIAQNAALRGLSVLLLEKADFAAGSSGKGSQLIDSESPRLERLGFNLTAKPGAERERLKRLAPHLVKDVSFVLPLMRKNTIFNLKTTVGFGLYDLLTMAAQRRNAHVYLTRRKLANLIPALRSELVAGGISFQDAITDDARLVLSVVKSAQLHGATALNYVQASGFEMGDGHIKKVVCHDRYSGEEFRASCKLFINATGVWADDLCKTMNAEKDSKLGQPRKSTRIIVPASSFETNCGLLLPGSDGRFVFVLPWQHALLIGATDESCDGAELDHPAAGQDEVQYLLDTVNSYANKQQQLSLNDVKSSFASLSAEPAPAEEARGGPAEPGDYSLIEHDNGMVSVLGARLNNYRQAAEELMEFLSAKHSWLGKGKSNTELAMLGGWSDKEEFPARSMAIELKAKRLHLEPAVIEHLISNYGAEAEHIIDLVEREPSLNERIAPDFPATMAEVPFAIIGEMAVSLQDFMLRRCRLGLLNRRQALEAAPKVASVMGKILGWDNYRTQLELSALEQEIFAQIEEVDPVGI